MSDKIEVGDRFLIEVEVVTIDVGVGLIYVMVPGGSLADDTSYFTPKELLSGKRIPRPIKVGDKVKRHTGIAIRGTVEWVDAPHVLIRRENGVLGVEQLGDWHTIPE
jgi:hypothetical protein